MSDAIRGQRPFDQPLVSICVPTYNAAKTVKQTLESVLNQTYRNIEVIIVDNASTDDTLSVVREINDPRIRIYCNKTNIGAERNFSKCVHLANGEYTAIFHADDLYMPDMVQKQVQAFQDNPTIGAVFTMAKLINNRGKVIGRATLPSELRNKEVFQFPEVFVAILSNLNFLVCPSAMVKGELYKQLVPFDVEHFGTSADLDMWLRILQTCPIAILDEPLMEHRVSSAQGSYTTRYLRTELADFFKVMDHYLGSESSALRIPRKALRKYAFLRAIDNIRRAVNHLIKGHPQKARPLLKRILSRDAFLGALSSIKKGKFLVYWFSGVILLALVQLGFGPYLGKILHWLLYRWKRRAYA